MAQALSTLLTEQGTGGLGKCRDEAVLVQDYTLCRIHEIDATCLEEYAGGLSIHDSLLFLPHIWNSGT